MKHRLVTEARVFSCTGTLSFRPIALPSKSDVVKFILPSEYKSPLPAKSNKSFLSVPEGQADDKYQGAKNDGVGCGQPRDRGLPHRPCMSAYDSAFTLASCDF